VLRVVPAFQLDLVELEQAAGCTQEVVVNGGFSRQLRLLKPAEFKQVFSNACRIGTKHLTMLAIHNHLGHPRLGLAISKKNVRRAVKRNLVKRQLRESFRLHQAIIGDFDVVVLARPGVDTLSRHELREQIDGCWQKIAKKCVPS
jgi:ribonuclease P protein component